MDILEGNALSIYGILLRFCHLFTSLRVSRQQIWMFFISPVNFIGLITEKFMMKNKTPSSCYFTGCSVILPPIFGKSNTRNIKKTNQIRKKIPVPINMHINPLWTRRMCVIQGLSPYRAVNTLRWGYKNQTLNDVKGKSYCLFWEPYQTHKCNVINIQNFLILNLVVQK